MLVEHKFVTTAEQEAAFQAVEMFLTEIGFGVEYRSGPALRFRRGREKAHPKYSPVEWPQAVHVEFDRGRVSVAASLTEFRQRKPEMEGLLVALVTCIEGLLAMGSSLDDARGQYAMAAARVDEYFRKVRLRRRITIGVFIALIVGIVILISWASSQ